MASKCINTPLGKLFIAAIKDGVCEVSFQKPKNFKNKDLSKQATSHIIKLEKALTRYFAGDYKALNSLQLATSGTPFQLAVWKELRKIPAGKTKTYGEIARKLGRPNAFRAVGTACGKNPLLLVTPCHRVVASNGLGGFAAGLEKKIELLSHEAK